MRNQIHKRQNVDIYNMPSELLLVEGATQVSLGDLHANAMKLMYFLVVHGIVSIEKKDYDSLSTMYLKNHQDLKQDDLDQFDAIIKKMQINKTTLEHILLIGDEFADRGNNDWFVLKILDRLHTSGVIDTTVLFSNHGLEYILACESASVQSYRPRVAPGQAQSFTNLQAFMDVGFVSWSGNPESIDAMNQRSYYPSLKLISYVIDNKEIALFTHAPTDLKHISELASILKTTFDDSTIDRLKQSLDDINAAFSIHVHNKTVHTLLKPLTPAHEKAGFPGDPINFIAWNRRSDILKRDSQHKGYGVHYVHGHDIAALEDQHIHNLDNCLGKFPVEMDEKMARRQGLPDSQARRINELHVLSSSGLCPSSRKQVDTASIDDASAASPIPMEESRDLKNKQSTIAVEVSAPRSEASAPHLPQAQPELTVIYNAPEVGVVQKVPMSNDSEVSASRYPLPNVSSAQSAGVSSVVENTPRVPSAAAKDLEDEVIVRLREHIETLTQKNINFGINGHSAAQISISRLIEAIERAIKNYEDSTDREGLAQAIIAAVVDARPELEKHRGRVTKSIVDNLQHWTGGNYNLFKIRTQSAVILDQLDELAEQLRCSRPTAE